MKLYESFDGFAIDRPSDGVLRILLNRPDRLNALDEDGHRQLADIWRVIARDDQTRAVLLAAEGRAFSAGGDFAVVEDLATRPEARARMFREARDLVFGLIDCPKPVVSAIKGSAVGAGLAAALLSDIPVATKSAKLVDGHVRLGVAAGDHAAIIWPLLCGMAKAKYHLLLNEPVTGEAAERMGLVALCVEDDELDAQTMSIVERLAAGSPSALQWTKHSLNNWLRLAGPSFDASLALEMLGFTGGDMTEGLKSLRERRDPSFAKSSGM
ncbi:multifunctional fatty acid oxidation complex subunit alpha (plasmid) [Antarctobacter heliothermus]|uniref:Multifunctional fatty acid oxidation complex subunit alpha n=1 Tax=Antarctobacter heliothermus TaxID=74033 RepID=A0A222EBD9_9RHOB|nr:enoyl-CoA hydratase/isomerase family protein [Antarctobacter heliothermus]ASP23507.1 multifunctional fatty acid oxidation complex subunit alpha [Antarctobacter heliothermus]